MRSLKVKLLSVLMALCLVVTFLIVGIWAVGTQTINLKGQVDFSISDPSLYVKDIRIKNSMEDASYSGETIDNFVPGYVNTTMNLNLGQIDNSTGGLSIYIDIINTTDITYVASTTSSISGADITVSGTINGDAISQGDILTTDTPSGTVEIVISAPGIATLDLEQFSISLEEKQDGYTVTFNDSENGMNSADIFYIKSDSSDTIYNISYGKTVEVPVNSLLMISDYQSYLSSGLSVNYANNDIELEPYAIGGGAHTTNFKIYSTIIGSFSRGEGTGIVGENLTTFTAVENDIVNTYTSEDQNILYIEVTSDIEITFSQSH